MFKTLTHFFENSLLSFVFVFMIMVGVVPYISLYPVSNSASKNSVQGASTYKISNFTFSQNPSGVTTVSGVLNEKSEVKIPLSENLVNKSFYVSSFVSSDVSAFIEGTDLIFINNNSYPVKIKGVLY